MPMGQVSRALLRFRPSHWPFLDASRRRPFLKCPNKRFPRKPMVWFSIWSMIHRPRRHSKWNVNEKWSYNVNNNASRRLNGNETWERWRTTDATRNDEGKIMKNRRRSSNENSDAMKSIGNTWWRKRTNPFPTMIMPMMNIPSSRWDRRVRVSRSLRNHPWNDDKQVSPSWPPFVLLTLRCSSRSNPDRYLWHTEQWCDRDWTAVWNRSEWDDHDTFVIVRSHGWITFKQRRVSSK